MWVEFVSTLLLLSKCGASFFLCCHFCNFCNRISSFLQVRVQAIRGLPLFCKDTPEYLSKIIDILVQLLVAGKLDLSWPF